MNASNTDPRVRPQFLVHIKPPKGGEAFYPETSESDYTHDGAMAAVIADPAGVDKVVMIDLADGICRDVTEDMAQAILKKVRAMGFCSLPLADFLMEWCGLDYREREEIRGASASSLEYLDRATAADQRRHY